MPAKNYSQPLFCQKQKISRELKSGLDMRRSCDDIAVTKFQHELDNDIRMERAISIDFNILLPND